LRFEFLAVLAALAVVFLGCTPPPQGRTDAPPAVPAEPVASAAAPLSVKPATGVEIPYVRSLADLKTRTLIPVDGDWQVALGWGDAGPAGGPWRLLYCWAEYTGQEARPSLPQGVTLLDQELGPVQVTVAPSATYRMERLMKRLRMETQGFTPRRGLYAAVVPVAWEGEYHISILGSNGTRVGQAVWKIEKPEPCGWHIMASGKEGGAPGEPDSTVAPDGWAVVPKLQPLLPIWQPTPETEAKALQATMRSLPGQVPSPLFWLGEAAGPAWEKAEADAAGVKQTAGLKLTLEGRDLVIRSEVDIEMDAHVNLAVRWWVGDRPVPARRSEVPVLNEARRMTEAGTERKVRFRVPISVGEVKAGDRVGLQVMHSPAGFSAIQKERDHAQMMEAEKRLSRLPNVLLLSNRLELKVEPWMLRDRGNPGEL
jgi:hypothetical protein